MDKLIEYGYKEIDVNHKEKISTSLKSNLMELDENIHEITNYLDDNVETFTYENGKVKYSFTYNKTKKIEIENVKEVKYSYIDCMADLYIFITTNNNEVWNIHTNSMLRYNENEEMPIIRKLKNKYTDIKELFLHSNTCGSTSTYIGVDNYYNYYDLENEKIIDLDMYFISDSLEFMINKNYDIYYNNRITGIKYNFGIFESATDEMQFFVSEDNYLYDLQLKKYTDSKIKNILVLPDNHSSRFIIIFENGKYLEKYYSYYKEY